MFQILDSNIVHNASGNDILTK